MAAIRCMVVNLQSRVQQAGSKPHLRDSACVRGASVAQVLREHQAGRLPQQQLMVDHHRARLAPSPACPAALAGAAPVAAAAAAAVAGAPVQLRRLVTVVVVGRQLSAADISASAAHDLVPARGLLGVVAEVRHAHHPVRVLAQERMVSKVGGGLCRLSKQARPPVRQQAREEHSFILSTTIIQTGSKSSELQ